MAKAKRWEDNAREIIAGEVAHYFDGRKAEYLRTIGMSKTSYRRREQDPRSISLGELKRIITATRMSDEDILRVIRGR